MPFPLLRTRAACVIALACATLLFTSCADPWSSPHPEPTAVGEPGAGFFPESTPTPEATVEPVPGTWESVDPSSGYRVVLLTVGDDDPTTTLVSGVQRWAQHRDVDLRVVDAEQDHVGGADAAIGMSPDLIVIVGEELIDLMAIVTANHLHTQFLVLGAEIAEPTENVTAVDWTGAGFRGEGLGTAGDYDAASFTPERADAAIRAGVAAVLNDLTGVVLWLG